MEPRHELQRSKLNILIISEEENDVRPGIFHVDFTGVNTVETKHQQPEKLMNHHRFENSIGINR